MKGPIKVEGLRVEVKYDNFEKALRTFSKKVQNSGLLRDIRERQHYEKPSSVRKKAKMSAVRRERKRRTDDRTKYK